MSLEEAVAAIDAGDLVVYPTETVYGLGADALDADAVEAVFEAKGRSRDKPVSAAFGSVKAALAHTDPGDRARAFMDAFLPGPVTVVVPRGPSVPDVLTAGRQRVGVRVPDHETARELAARAGPVTATSANVSGEGSARRPAAVGERVRERAAVVIDGGETPGGGSTVVNPETGEIVREGAASEGIREWLEANA